MSWINRLRKLFNKPKTFLTEGKTRSMVKSPSKMKRPPPPPAPPPPPRYNGVDDGYPFAPEPPICIKTLVDTVDEMTKL